MASGMENHDELSAFEDLVSAAFEAVSGRISTTLGGADVSLVAANVASHTVESLVAELATPLVRAVVTLEGPIPETASVFAVSVDDAKVAADLMMGGTGEEPQAELEEFHRSAVQELLQYVAEGVSQHIGNQTGTAITSTLDNVAVVTLSDELDELQTMADGGELALVTASFICGSPVLSFYAILSGSAAVALSGQEATPTADALASDAAGESASGPAAAAPEPASESRGAATLTQEELAAVLGGLGLDETDAAPPARPAAATPAQSQPGAGQVLGASRLERAPLSPGSVAPPSVARPASEARPVEFASVDAPEPGGLPENFQLISNIPVTLSVELGRTRRTIGEIMEFGTGSTIQLDKAADEPVDILAGGKTIARGEVVVIDENFAVRIRQILRPLRNWMDMEGGE